MLELLRSKPLLGLIPSSMPPVATTILQHLTEKTAQGLYQWQVHLAWLIGLTGGVVAIVAHLRKPNK